jgi:hypothetical protein
MFGKGKSKMSSNDKFVMAKGREAGNVGNTKGGAKPRGSSGPNPFADRKLSPGQVNTFKTRGK